MLIRHGDSGFSAAFDFGLYLGEALLPIPSTCTVGLQDADQLTSLPVPVTVTLATVSALTVLPVPFTIRFLHAL